MNHNKEELNQLQKQQNINDKPIMYIVFNGSKQLTVTQRITHIKDVLIEYMDDLSLNELLFRTGSYFSPKQKNQLETNLNTYCLWRKAGQPIKEITIPSESYQHILNQYKFKGDKQGSSDPEDKQGSGDQWDPLDNGDHGNQENNDDHGEPVNQGDQGEPVNPIDPTDLIKSVYQADLELANQLISLLTTSDTITHEDIFISPDQISFCIKPITKSQLS